MPTYVATDIGGTFTDLASWDPVSGRLTVQKTPTTTDFSQGVLHAVDVADVELHDVAQFRHGSTIAINTVLEGTGANTAVVTTDGFADVLEAGRGNRPNPFDLNAEGHRVLVPRSARLEVEERIRAEGQVHHALTPSSVDVCVERLRNIDCDAIAICLLHSYVNAEHEQQLVERLRQAFPDRFVVASHQVCLEAKEFERTSTTVVHSYVGPIVDSYTASLINRLKADGYRHRLLLMQSNGGLMRAERARERPALLMESGPASGVMGTIELARTLELDRAVAFDMGGTTAKASLIEDANPSFLDVYYIGGYDSGLPLLAPVIDIHEVGAGGGSIAWLDAAEAIHVGPRSAGSVPGPICYGKGGDRPTVCDADLILGRLHPGDQLGGDITLDVEAARAGISEQIAEPLGLSLERAALGVVTIANTVMAQAVGKVSIERGHDPRDFALVAYGGAGPMHATDVARELGITTVIIPPVPGVFSSMGMLFSPLRGDRKRTLHAPLDEEGLETLQRHAASLQDDLRAELPDPDSDAREGTWVAFRFAGQEHARRVDIETWDLARITDDFERRYEDRYGYLLPDAAIQATTVGAWREVPQPTPDWHTDRHAVEPAWLSLDSHRMYFETTGWVEPDVLWRPSFQPGDNFGGPTLIVEPTSTTVLSPDMQVRVGELGELVIDVSEV